MIPQEAVEAARAAIRKESMKIHGWGESENAVARAALEAAAPFLRAQALEDAADMRFRDGSWVFGLPARQKLRTRAFTERERK